MTDVTSTSPPASRGRLILARTLVVLGLLIGALGLFAGYVNWQVFDEDTFEQTAADLVADEAIRSQLAATLSQQLFANIDVKAELEAQLPEDQKGLAGADHAARCASSATAPPTSCWAGRVCRRCSSPPPWSRSGWPSARWQTSCAGSRRATACSCSTCARRSSSSASELEFLGNIADRLPEGVGVIEIAEVDRFETAQEATEIFRNVAPVLPFVALGLMGAGIALARGRRRRELRAVAIGFVVVGVLMLVLRRIAGRVVVDELSPTSSTDEAVDHVWSILTALFVDGAWTVIILGIAAFVGLWLSSERGLGAPCPLRTRPGPAHDAGSPTLPPRAASAARLVAADRPVRSTAVAPHRRRPARDRHRGARRARAARGSRRRDRRPDGAHPRDQGA